MAETFFSIGAGSTIYNYYIKHNCGLHILDNFRQEMHSLLRPKVDLLSHSFIVYIFLLFLFTHVL